MRNQISAGMDKGRMRALVSQVDALMPPAPPNNRKT